MMNRYEYLLNSLMEECAETVQRASKAKRFGLHEVQPGQKLTNCERVIEEYSDIVMVAEMMAIYPHDPVTARLQKWNDALDVSLAQGTIDANTADSLRLPTGPSTHILEPFSGSYIRRSGPSGPCPCWTCVRDRAQQEAEGE